MRSVLVLILTFVFGIPAFPALSGEVEGDGEDPVKDEGGGMREEG